jgi:ABC-type sugar transport system ATPase subunit
MIHPAASIEGVDKRFGATVALDNVDFDVGFGEIHAIVGENGAGKSTLIRILGGVHRPDRGIVRVGGVERHFASPREAIAAGIVTIPQELRLVPALSVAENIALGDLPVRRLGPLAMIDRGRMRREAAEVLSQLDFEPDLDRSVRSLGFAERQLVAIGKALRRRCRIFILDEPTAALEKREIDRLFAVIARMKRQGTAIIYISHRLDEVVVIADRCTVLRDGRVTAVRRRGDFSAADLVAAMTGRASEDGLPAPAATGEILLSAPADGVHDLRVRSGEVVGLAGLLGSGADAMLRRLFGIAGPTNLELRKDKRLIKHPAHAIAAGIGMVPGERMLGLVMNQSVRDNILLPNLDALSRLGWLDRNAGEAVVTELMELLDIRPRQPQLLARALSGGNQQKVILAKWLARRVAVLLLEEPTQGIDVAAKAQIHALIRDFVAPRPQPAVARMERSEIRAPIPHSAPLHASYSEGSVGAGGGVLITSSDLAELVRLCERVLAVRQGRITATLDRAAGLDEPKLRAAIGG